MSGGGGVRLVENREHGSFKVLECSHLYAQEFSFSGVEHRREVHGQLLVLPFQPRRVLISATGLALQQRKVVPCGDDHGDRERTFFCFFAEINTQTKTIVEKCLFYEPF